jgi:predicted dinucleotide-binding enzyme
MTSVTIFGSGNMGTAIDDVLTAGGATVEHLTTSAAPDTPINGDIVILAVPYSALGEIAVAYGDQLAGKVVVDVTNPLNLETFDSLAVPADSSAAAELAAALPESQVLTAFNTNVPPTLDAQSDCANKTTGMIAGDDAEAKSALADAVQAGGLEAVDAGSLNRAAELEALGFLQLKLALAEQVSWTSGFALVR